MNTVLKKRGLVWAERGKLVIKLQSSFMEDGKWQWCCDVKSDPDCCFSYSFQFSKALADLHIDDLLEPEGYDTLPG